MKNFHRKMWGHYKTMKAMATDTEAVHGQMQSIMVDFGHYYRLNVQKGLGSTDVPLDACKGKGGNKTLALIRRKTEEYLEKESTRTSIGMIARRLVDIRRARSNGPDREQWKRFCHGLKYKCPVSGCRDSAKRWEERLSLRNHLTQEHSSSFNANTLEPLLDDGKIYTIEESE